jgi:hypothetical protein
VSRTKRLTVIGLLTAFTWAWTIAGGSLGYHFAIQSLHLHAFILILAITLVYALLAILLLALLIALPFSLLPEPKATKTSSPLL